MGTYYIVIEIRIQSLYTKYISFSLQNIY